MDDQEQNPKQEEENQQSSPKSHPIAKKVGNEAAKRIVGKGANAAASALGSPAAGKAAEVAVGQLLDKEKRERDIKLAIWVVGGSIAIFFFLLFFLLGGDSELQQTDPTQIQISKTGPETAQVNDILTYTIPVSYTGDANEITITDPIPDNAEFVESNPKAEIVEENGKKIARWKLTNYQGSGRTTGIQTTITITLKALQNNSYIINQAFGATAPGGGTGEGSYGGAGTDGLIKAGEDVKYAFEQCGRPLATTYNPPDLACVRSTLKQLGHTDDRIAAFERRRINSLVNQSYIGGSGSCNECVGFIGMAVALWTGDSGAFMNNANVLAGYNSHRVGEFTFIKVSGPIQPGDVGITALKRGHIAVVKEPVGQALVRFVEGNTDGRCKVGYRDAPTEGYFFFRKQ